MTRLLPALLLSLAAVSTVPAGELGLTLVDPATGRSTTVEAGPRALHVVFFATWCPECVAELSRLGELAARYSGRGYQLLLVAVPTRQDAARLTRFIEQEDPPGRLLFDAEGRVASRLGAGALPTHVLFDAGGTEVARSERLDRDFEAALERLIGRRGGRP